MRDIFSVLLSNFAKYFPFSQVEYDLQNDMELTENAEAKIDDVKKVQIQFLRENGFSDEMIILSYPGMEEDVKKFLKELSYEK